MGKMARKVSSQECVLQTEPHKAVMGLLSLKRDLYKKRESIYI